jgi:hypothetical protein
MENARKVSKRIRRIRRKYLSIYGENGELLNLRIRGKYLNVFGEIRGKNLCVHGVDAKRLLTYSPYTPKDIKVCLSQLIIIRI